MGGGAAFPAAAKSPGPPGPPPRAAANPAKPAEAGRRALAGFLVSYQEDPLGKFWPIYQGRNVVGRADTGQTVDVAIAHGTTSTNHAAVDCEDQRLSLVDLGSTNGTYQNEEPIGVQSRREVRDGDKIRFGGFTVTVLHIAARG